MTGFAPIRLDGDHLARTVGEHPIPRYAADERSDIPKAALGEPDTTTNRKNARDARAADAVLG